MPLTNAMDLAQILTESWLIENYPWTLQIPRAWAWRGIAGSKLIFPRTAKMTTFGSVGTGTCDSEIPDQTNQVESTPEFELVSLLTRYSICMGDVDRIRDPQLLDRVLWELAKIRLLYTYFERVGKVNSTVSQFPGLPDIVGAGQTIDMATASLTFAAVDQAYRLVVSNQGRPNAIMSNRRALRTFASMYFTGGGGEPNKVLDTWMDPIRGQVTAEITAFNGTPWYINDLIPDDEPEPGTETGTIFFMVLGDDSGPGPYRGITGIVPQGLESNWFVKRQANGISGTQMLTVPAGGGVFAITPPTLPTVDTFVSWPTGLAMGAQGALSILKGFRLIADLPTT